MLLEGQNKTENSQEIEKRIFDWRDDGTEKERKSTWKWRIKKLKKIKPNRKKCEENVNHMTESNFKKFMIKLRNNGLD